MSATASVPAGCRCVYVVNGNVTTQRIAHPDCPSASAHDAALPVLSYPLWTAPVLGQATLQVIDPPDPLAVTLFRTPFAAAAAMVPPTQYGAVPAGAHVGQRYLLPNGITVEVIARPTT